LLFLFPTFHKLLYIVYHLHVLTPTFSAQVQRHLPDKFLKCIVYKRLYVLCICAIIIIIIIIKCFWWRASMSSCERRIVGYCCFRQGMWLLS